MHLTQEQLNSITELAEYFFSPKKIAVNLEVDIEEFQAFIDAEEGEIYQAYMKGYITGELKLRMSIAKMAHNGSRPAQDVMLKFINKNE
jgi:hypothetical protein